MKATVGKVCTVQHKLTGDLKVFLNFRPKRKFVSGEKIWKLRDLANQIEFSKDFRALIYKN